MAECTEGQKLNNRNNNAQSNKGSKDGKDYELFSIMLLLDTQFDADLNGYGVGREVSIGRDEKFSDIAISYQEENVRKLIFCQTKHKETQCSINTNILTRRAKFGGGGNSVNSAFNLQQYFISFLDLRKKLNSLGPGHPSWNHVNKGTLKYVALYTTAELNKNELRKKHIYLEEAPKDIKQIFNIKKNSSWQIKFDTMNNSDLKTILNESSDLHLLARELAKYVIGHTEKPMEANIEPFKYYYEDILKYVIEEDQEIPCNKEQYFIGMLKKGFMDSKADGPIQVLCSTMMHHIRVLQNHTTKSEEQIFEEVKSSRWEVKTADKKSSNTFFPEEWDTIVDDDIKDFFNKFVFIVKQPNSNQLLSEILKSLKQKLISNSETKILEDVKGMMKIKKNDKDKWISQDDYLRSFEDAKKCGEAAVFSVILNYYYQHRVISYDLNFKGETRLEKCLQDFLGYEQQAFKILHVVTLAISLTNIKLLQFAETNHRKYIAIEFEKLENHLDTEKVLKFLKVEDYKIVIIEFKNDKNQNVDQLKSFLKSVRENDKDLKIVVVSKQDDDLIEKFEEVFKDIYKREQDEDIRFSLLDEGSQTKILDKKVSFNGTPKGNSFREIFELGETFDETTQKQLESSIDPETMANIISSTQTILHKTTEEEDYAHECNFYSTFERIEKYNLATKFHKYNKDLFTFCGIQRDIFEQKYKDLYSIVCDSEFYNVERINLIKDNDEKSFSRRFNEICREKSSQNFENFHLFEFRNNDLHWKQSYDPSLYIPRTFNPVLIDVEVLKDNLNDIFALTIEGLSLENISELKAILTSSFQIEEGLIKCYDSNDTSMGHIIILNNSTGNKEFYELCERYTLDNHNIHWLEYNLTNRKLIWKRSKGGVHIFRNYLSKEISEIKRKRRSSGHIQDKSSEIKEKDFINLFNYNDIILITDEPGMGKSTTLLSQIKQMDESIWNIKIDFISFTEQLSKIEHLDLTSENILGSLIDIIASQLYAGEQITTAKLILLYRLKYQGKIIFWFDGFDEIQLIKNDCLEEMQLIKNDCLEEMQSYERVAINMLVYLKNKTKSKIVVTTRNHKREILEDSLSVLAYTFVSLNSKEQDDYLERFWKLRLMFHDENKEIKKFDSLYDNFQDIINDSSFGFLGNLLLIRLFAEITGYNKEVKNEMSFDLINLYEEFIKKKFKIVFEKKKLEDCETIDILKKHYYKTHRILALNNIFSENPLYQKSLLTPKMENKFKIILEKDFIKDIGIVQFKDPKGRYSFIHKTFAEYFVANYLANCFTPFKTGKTYSEKLFVIKEILIKDYKVIRKFLNTQFFNWKIDMDVFGSIISDDDYKWNFFLWKNVSGETSLHVAAKENNSSIASFLLHNLSKSNTACIKLLITRDYSGKTPLYVSTEYMLDELVDKILKVPECEYDFKKIILSTLFTKQIPEENDCVTKMLLQKPEIQTVYERIIEIWILLIDNLKEAIKGGYFSLNSVNHSIVRYAILAIDGDRNNFLHLASSKGHTNFLLEMLNFLEPEQRNEELFCRNSQKNTILIEAIINRHADTTKAILKLFGKQEKEKKLLKKFLSAKNERGNSAIHEAVKIGDTTIIRPILESIGEDIAFFGELLKMNNYKESSPLRFAFLHSADIVAKQIINFSRIDAILFEEIISTVFSKQFLKSIEHNLPCYSAFLTGFMEEIEGGSSSFTEQIDVTYCKNMIKKIQMEIKKVSQQSYKIPQSKK